MKGNELKAARAYLGMTQEEFGREIVGGARDTVRRYERGEHPIPKPLALLLEWLVWDRRPTVQGRVL